MVEGGPAHVAQAIAAARRCPRCQRNSALVLLNAKEVECRWGYRDLCDYRAFLADLPAKVLEEGRFIGSHTKELRRKLR